MARWNLQDMSIPSGHKMLNEYEKWEVYEYELQKHIRTWEEELRSVQKYVVDLKIQQSHLAKEMKKAGDLSLAIEKMRNACMQCYPDFPFDPSKVWDHSVYYGDGHKIADYRYGFSFEGGVEINYYMDQVHIRKEGKQVRSFSAWAL
jgi:hypothetical protein